MRQGKGILPLILGGGGPYKGCDSRAVTHFPAERTPVSVGSSEQRNGRGTPSLSQGGEAPNSPSPHGMRVSHKYTSDSDMKEYNATNME